VSALPGIEINGQPVEADWTLDRGLHYGDGLFETMLVSGGRIRFEALHRSRFTDGCHRMGLDVDQDPLWSYLQGRAQATPEALFKLLVTRGPARRRGYAPAGDEVPRRVLFRYPAPTMFSESLDVVRLATRLGDNPLLAGFKHCNRLEFVLAARELAGRQAGEGLLASVSGRLISGTMSNVYVLRRGRWMTPRVDRCGIAGVTRAVVMREAALAGEPVIETDLPYEVLEDCEALCVSNVRLGLCPVDSLDGRPLATPDWALRMRARIGALCE
jgi:4-amino-4-deoxychorismate lyase